jgi:hypothetical protein
MKNKIRDERRLKEGVRGLPSLRILAEAAGAQKGSREGNERGDKKLY